MNNLIIKPLFKKEISHIKWIVLLMIAALLLPILASINTSIAEIEMQKNDPNSYAYYYQMNSYDLLEMPFYDLLTWLTLPILVIIQFFYMRKDSVGNMLASLPYKRKDRIRTKYIAGIIAITLTYITAFIVISASYYSSIQPISGEYKYIPIWLVVALTSMIFQYSFIFLIATLIGNSVFAGIFGFLAIYTPIFLVGSYASHIDRFFNTNISYLLSDSLFPKIFIPQFYAIQFQNINFLDSQNEVFSKSIYTVILYMILSIVFYKLAQLAFSKNELEHNGNLCMFKWAEVVFAIGFTLCFGSLALLISSIFMDGWLEPIMTIAAFICYPLGFFFSKKIMQMTGYQSDFIKKNLLNRKSIATEQ